MAPTIFVAIDVDNEQAAKALFSQLSPEKCGVKIGKELFTACGPSIIKLAKQFGYAVFLDLKFHDIPHTAAKACLAAAKLEVDFLTVHVLGGINMLKTIGSVLRQAELTTALPKILGVTLLTSLEATDLPLLGFRYTTKQLIQQLAQLAKQHGLDGIVCSAQEVMALKPLLGNNFLFATPGIRPSSASCDDQKRILTPQQAQQAGSDLLIIGRPIIKAKEPIKILDQLIEQLN